MNCLTNPQGLSATRCIRAPSTLSLSVPPQAGLKDVVLRGKPASALFSINLQQAWRQVFRLARPANASVIQWRRCFVRLTCRLSSTRFAADLSFGAKTRLTTGSPTNTAQGAAARRRSNLPQAGEWFRRDRPHNYSRRPTVFGPLCARRSRSA